MKISPTLLDEELDKVRGSVADYIQQINDTRDDVAALREVLQRILMNQEKIEEFVDKFFVVIQLILKGSVPVKGSDFAECVAIGNDKEGFFASGVLLSKEWLLTSSHCRDATKMFVGIEIDGSGTVYPITLQEQNDLLILFKVSGFQGTVDRPLLPPDNYALNVGTPLRVVAFGDTSPSGGFFGQKRQARFLIDLALNVRIRASSDSGVCPGDSGGPAFYDDNNKPRLLLGICDSTKGDDCRSGGIFANVVGKKRWIESVTGLTPASGRRRSAIGSQSDDEADATVKSRSVKSRPAKSRPRRRKRTTV